MGSNGKICFSCKPLLDIFHLRMRKSNFNFKVSFAKFDKSLGPCFLICVLYIYTNNSHFHLLEYHLPFKSLLGENHTLCPRVKAWEVFEIMYIFKLHLNINR